MILNAQGQEIKGVSLDKLKRFMEFEQTLRENHWSLVCRKCANFIAGDNHPGGTRISVKCSCRELVFDAGGN